LNAEKHWGSVAVPLSEKGAFAAKSVVNLKNEQKHIVNKSMIKQDSSGGGNKWLKQPLKK
jgi:hypothetical protein